MSRPSELDKLLGNVELIMIRTFRPVETPIDPWMREKNF
jgi:hypothetical protein